MTRQTFKKQQGVSTLIMILAIGAAMAASLYGAYSHMEASGKSQNTSTARTQARALAQDALAASAAYFNQLFCGSTSSTCASGNAENLSATAIPAGMVLLDQTTGTNTMTAQVVSNTFATNGDIEIDATGQTASGLAQIRAYLHAATIYSFTPLQYAFLINGSQVLTGNVSINTGTNSLTVVGNLGIQGSASVTGTAQATGTITDSTGSCGSTATCSQNIDPATVVSPSIDAYNLSGEANAVLSVDASGQAQVTFENDAALTPTGTLLLSALSSSNDSLCAAGGYGCITPPSGQNGTWAITGTPTPGVLFFYGDVTVAAKTIGSAGANPVVGYATILATGNVYIGKNNDIVAYGQMPNVCNQTVIPTNVCPDGVNTTSPGEGTGAVANAVLISGGSVNYPYASGATVYVNGAASNTIPPINDTTETAASNTVQPSGTVTGYFCTSSGVSTGSAATCLSTSTTIGIITGGNVTLDGNSDLTGVVAAGESLTAVGTGTITGMIDTANTNNTSTSTLGNNTSTNDVNGNLKIKYAPGVSNATNFGGGGQTPEMAFMPVWQRYY